MHYATFLLHCKHPNPQSYEEKHPNTCKLFSAIISDATFQMCNKSKATDYKQKYPNPPDILGMILSNATMMFIWMLLQQENRSQKSSFVGLDINAATLKRQNSRCNTIYVGLDDIAF